MIRKKKYKVRRKALLVTFYSLNKGLGGDAVQICQVRIQHDLLPASSMNSLGKR